MAVEPVGRLEIPDVQVDVPHHRACRHAGPRRVTAGRHDRMRVERLGRHHELAVGVLPRRTLAVGIDLDAESVGIREIERFAHQVVRHPGPFAACRQVREQAPERRAIGQQDREVEKPEAAPAVRRCRAGHGVQRDERRGVAGRTKLHGVVRGRDLVQPEHVAIVGARAREV